MPGSVLTTDSGIHWGPWNSPPGFKGGLVSGPARQSRKVGNRPASFLPILSLQHHKLNPALNRLVKQLSVTVPNELETQKFSSPGSVLCLFCSHSILSQVTSPPVVSAPAHVSMTSASPVPTFPKSQDHESSWVHIPPNCKRDRIDCTTLSIYPVPSCAITFSIRKLLPGLSYQPCRHRNCFQIRLLYLCFYLLALCFIVPHLGDSCNFLPGSPSFQDFSPSVFQNAF